ncbi:hypothetical protein AB5J62_32945 [Amycolatopsis sp. cg5]|uniref:hypothetical protein n=1 Tax=Amycolatopsis sp. cg5 TaxID=3238802 RepID=UPI0035260BBE
MINRARSLILAACLLVTGCGVQPTGVVDGGPPIAGVSEGMRLYFVTDQGVRGVARPGLELSSLDGVIKLLMGGLNQVEIANGYTTLVVIAGPFSAWSVNGQVTLRLPKTPVDSVTGMFAGQLVCTLARAETVLNGTRPDAVRVTIIADGGTAGPYQCFQFLNA